MGGNWGTNIEFANQIPDEYIQYLKRVNANYIGIFIALHVEDSMDSSVERKYAEVDIPTFSDETLEYMTNLYKSHGFDVYFNLAFEPFEAEVSDKPLARHELGLPSAPKELPIMLIVRIL